MPPIKVPGFRFAGVACGIKKSGNKDVALIVADRAATAAALFTTNRVKAAPVLLGMQRLGHRGKLQAVVVNSGNANACTGAAGLRAAEAMCDEASDCLGIDARLVLPSSTGVIGVPLPVEKLRAGIRRAAAALSEDSFQHAAQAIITTDRFIKTASANCIVAGKRVRIAGMAKGAGMIAPRMATMLAYVFTDAAVEVGCLRAILSAAADQTFNSVTVDGDMSTNDTVVLMANGVAGNAPVRRGSGGAAALSRAIYGVMKQLALKLVEDGEGATKLVEIRVEGARSTKAARQAAYAIARSQLVKTAFFGQDPNFGRIMAAIGNAGIPVVGDRIDVLFDRVAVVKKGVGNPAAEQGAARVLRRRSFRVRVRLGQGTKNATVWTSDLSHEYVRINSAYRT